ncbi:FAD binding domain-containing protein [Exophiala viscosa]|uniref:Fumarate reductase n=1 Tax=Exophiala viscosa TaxID=2486360 RepID=A0AAN6E500_9EURO|nr:FAD binding domain-containing protein [Exophiala viscosa]KAI1627322.1 FAD binding domain-containing protein [Exophiala viscosa]
MGSILQAPSVKQSVIVVGSGLAGLSAASELVARNVPVVILERQAKPGGNSIKASSGINGVPTRFQPPGLDSLQHFLDDTINSVSSSVMSTMTETRRSLISTLTSSSASAINWLVDEKGVDLSRVAQLGGHSHARTHRGAGQTPPGASIITTLLSQLKANPLVELQINTTVTKVLTSQGEVIGVESQQGGNVQTLHGPVVFATGGFAGDSTGALTRYRPDLHGYPSTNEALPGSQDLLSEIGAQLLDMDQVQVHPTGFIDPKDPSKTTKFLAAEALRGEGGILLRRGKRFVDELQTRKVVTEAITAQPPSTTEGTKQWDIVLLLDEKTYQSTKSHVDFYLWKGLMQKKTISELDHSDVVLETLEQYSDIVQGKETDALGRKSFGNWALREPKPDTVVYVGNVTPVVHYTMGGVLFTPDAEVLDADGKAIDGLWVAGEITGGIHGANRLGGSSLLECVVFGRIAGRNAARYVETTSDKR